MKLIASPWKRKHLAETETEIDTTSRFGKTVLLISILIKV